MTDLVAEIWLCLIVSALLGVVAGWLVWGRSTQRIIAEYRRRLAKIRRDWETVEGQLVESLSRTTELERALADRQSEHAVRETTLQSILRESEGAWKKERRLLEATVSGLDEHIRSLEAAARIHSIDVPTASNAVSLSLVGPDSVASTILERFPAMEPPHVPVVSPSESLRPKAAKRKDCAEVK